MQWIEEVEEEEELKLRKNGGLRERFTEERENKKRLTENRKGEKMRSVL